MSLKGSILRGEKWFHLNRDPNGDLTKEVKEQANKMRDIGIYLEAKAEHDAKTEAKPKSKGKK